MQIIINSVNPALGFICLGLLSVSIELRWTLARRIAREVILTAGTNQISFSGKTDCSGWRIPATLTDSQVRRKPVSHPSQAIFRHLKTKSRGVGFLWNPTGCACFNL